MTVNNLSNDISSTEVTSAKENDENELTKLIEDCEVNLTALRLVDICGINSTQKALSEPMNPHSRSI